MLSKIKDFEQIQNSYIFKGPVNHDDDRVDDCHIGVELALLAGGLPVELVSNVAPVGDGLLHRDNVLLLSDLSVGEWPQLSHIWLGRARPHFVWVLNAFYVLYKYLIQSS